MEKVLEAWSGGHKRVGGVIKSLYGRHLPSYSPYSPPFLLSTHLEASLHPPYYGHNVKGTPDEIEFANGKRE